MANVLNTTTGVLDLPKQEIEPWVKDIANGSCVASLTPSIPMIFGPGQGFTFDIGEAEYVGESAVKSGSTITPKKQTVTPFKFQKTVRMSNEILWADEDAQLQALRQILAKIQPALSRALDFGIFHGINPADGTAAVAMTQKLSSTTNIVTVGANKAYTYLDSADRLVLEDGFAPSDVALDPAWAKDFATARSTQTEQKLYPGFRLTTEVSELDGHRASVSRTVRALAVADAATNVLGFVGDFSTIQWGIQRQIGLEKIEFGDPDGQGDLKRNNEVAFRAEVLYGWGIADLNAIAVVKAATVDEDESSSSSSSSSSSGA